MKAQYSRTCPRCNGAGKYDRGTCFSCKGLGKVICSTKPAQTFEVSAIFSDGVRRVMRNRAAKTAQAAIEKVLSEREWIGFDVSTIIAK